MIFEAALETDEIVTETRHHTFPLAIAIKYSVHMALWIQHLGHWTEKHLSLNRNIYDGLCWNYDTIESLGEIFPYMTKSQRETIINNSIKEGLVVKGNYNQTKYDRTVWYALTPKAYVYFAHFLDEKHLKRLYSSISEKSEMDFLNFRNRFPKNRITIPDTKPDTDPYINNKGTSGEVPNIGYSEIDVDHEKPAESDYSHGQTEDIPEEAQASEIKPKNAKSDYFENQSEKSTKSPKSQVFDIKNILNDNPFAIPEQVIRDWMENRRKKRTAITQTAWSIVNKELAKCKEKGIDPIHAFETMVASGWQSLKVEYFESQKKPSEAPRWDLYSVLEA